CLRFFLRHGFFGGLVMARPQNNTVVLKSEVELIQNYNFGTTFPLLTLFYNEGTCIRTERIIQRYQHHTVTVRRLLRQDPLRTVLRVDPYERTRPGSQPLG